MVLSLITPTGPNFIKDWPSENTVNSDKIDAYANASLITHPLKSYTPIFTASTTNPVIGTGGTPLLRGFYYEIFDQLYTWAEFRFGTTAPSAGSGLWSMSLPFNVNSNIGPHTIMGRGIVVGTGFIHRNSTPTVKLPVTVHLKTVNTVQFGFRMNSGQASREITNAIPIPWAPSDGMTWSARFQRAP